MRTLDIFSMLVYLKEASGSHAFGVFLQLCGDDCETEIKPLYSLVLFFWIRLNFRLYPTEPACYESLNGITKDFAM
jgi:hypothetical protein